MNLPYIFFSKERKRKNIPRMIFQNGGGEDIFENGNWKISSMYGYSTGHQGSVFYILTKTNGAALGKTVDMWT